MSYDGFIAQNVAPYLSQKIGIFNSSGEKAGVIPLGNFKPEYGDRLYRFGILADVHNQTDQTSENTTDLQHALEYFNSNESVCMTIVAGDVTVTGSAEDLAIYQTNIQTKSPNTPVYTCVGNHDATSSGLNETQWYQYTGCHRTFELTKNGTDHFLFLGMNKYDLNTENGTPYLSADIDWLEEKLEQYRNERCFIIIHCFFLNYAGDYNNLYTATVRGTQGARLISLLNHYKNTIWISGHSHWAWNLQESDSDLNVKKSEGGWTVHIPSCAYPRRPSSSNSSGYYSVVAASEGGIIDIYRNYIDIRGMDLKNTKYIPIAQYRLDTTIQTVDSSMVSITNTLSHASNSNTKTEIIKGRSYTGTISALSGYELTTVTVTMGGTDITSTAYTSSTHAISIPNVTGAIVITVTTTAQLPVYTITNNLGHSTNSNSETSLIEGSSYSGTISASSGYAISSISVTMGGTNITSSAVNGNVITISSITGNLVITVSTISVYTITNNLTEVTNSNSSTSINSGASYSATLSATLTTGYGIGATVVMGGTNVTATAYNSSTHSISISNVTGNIVITASKEWTAEEVAVTWEMGSISSSNGVPRAASNAGARTADFITYDSSYTYFITTVCQKEGCLQITDVASLSYQTNGTFITNSKTALNGGTAASSTTRQAMSFPTNTGKFKIYHYITGNDAGTYDLTDQSNRVKIERALTM